MQSLKFLRISFRATFLGASLLVAFLGVANAQLPDWTHPFDPFVGNLEFFPVRHWGAFYESNSISVNTFDGSSVRVFDFRGTTVYEGAPGPLPSLPVGHYFVESPIDRAMFVVLPNDYQGASFLGVEADSGTDQVHSDILSMIKPGYARVVAAGGYWSEVQSAGPTGWWWAPLERTLSFNQGRKIILMASERPWWQTNDNQFVSLFAGYVQQAAKRYRNSIYAIEMWNEPWYYGPPSHVIPTADGTYDAFITNYVTLVRAGQKAVRSASSTIKVWGPAWASDSSNIGADLLNFAGAGGLTPLDGYSWHHYDNANPPDAKSDRLRTDDRMDYIARHVGPKQLAVDEVGLFGQSALGIPSYDGLYVSKPPINWYRAACRAIKEMVMHIGGGVSVYIPHLFALYTTELDGMDEMLGWDFAFPVGLYVRPRGPHPKASTTMLTAYWLNGATLLGRRVIVDKVFLYAWQRPNGERVTFAWSLEDQPVGIQLDGTENVTDIFGQPVSVTQLTEEPVLFHDNTTTDVSSLLDSLEAKLQRSNLNRAPILQPIVNQGVYQGFTMSFSVAAADPDSDPLTYSADSLPPGALFDLSTRRFTWTPSSNQVGTWPVTFSVSDGLASASQVVTLQVYSATTTGLTAYWKFNDGTGDFAADSAGNNTATLSNFDFNATSGWVDTERGRALGFDGINDYVSVSNSSYSVIPGNNSAFTISLWLQPSNLMNLPNQSWSAKAIMANNIAGTCGFRYAVLSNGQLNFTSYADGGSVDMFSNDKLSTGTWYHAVITYHPGIATMYLNGSPANINGNASATNWGTIVSSAIPIRIGHAAGSGGMDPFDGQMSDVMVFNRALSAEEIQALYQATQIAAPVTNAPPVWTVTPTQSAERNRTLTFTVAANDSDGDPIAYSAVGLPSGAKFDQITRTVLWIPSVSQNGTYSFTFLASDGLAIVTQMVAVTVNGSSAAPIMNRLRSKSVKAGQPLKIRLQAKSPLKKPLSYLAMSLPAGASFDPVFHQFTWTPTAGQTGSHTVTFVATDGRFTDTQTITLTVLAQ